MKNKDSKIEQIVEKEKIEQTLDKYRDTIYEKYEECDLLQYCRGCHAVAYGNTGNFSSPDPQCWK